MDKLAVDFPKARIVFPELSAGLDSSRGKTAAAYGVCVAKQGGSNAFFQFAAAVFDGQDGLATPMAPPDPEQRRDQGRPRSGQDRSLRRDPRPMRAVEASVKLAQDLNINQVPTLMVNGRQVPANAPYETIKKIVEYQAKLDGVAQ
jgi:protein-disulfide isomerase